MKTTNLDPEHQLDVTRGRKSTLRAGSSGITVRDGTSTGFRITDLTVVGGTLTVNDDGTAVLTIGGSAGQPGEDFLLSTGGGGMVDYTNDISGSALTLDMAAYSVFDITLSANLTLTFSNPPIDGRTHIWIFIIRQPASGGPFTLTWPAAVDFQESDGTGGGSDPTLFTAASAVNVFQVTTKDDGATYGGASVQAGASALDDLTDVTITAVAEDDTLRYNGSAWVNDDRRWEAVTNGEDVFVWESDDLVHEWKAY